MFLMNTRTNFICVLLILLKRVMSVYRLFHAVKYLLHIVDAYLQLIRNYTW